MIYTNDPPTPSSCRLPVTLTRPLSRRTFLLKSAFWIAQKYLRNLSGTPGNTQRCMDWTNIHTHNKHTHTHKSRFHTDANEYIGKLQLLLVLALENLGKFGLFCRWSYQSHKKEMISFFETWCFLKSAQYALKSAQYELFETSLVLLVSFTGLCLPCSLPTSLTLWTGCNFFIQTTVF